DPLDRQPEPPRGLAAAGRPGKLPRVRHARCQITTLLFPESATASRSPCSHSPYGQHSVSRATPDHRVSPFAVKDGCPSTASAACPEAVGTPCQSRIRLLAVSATARRSPSREAA